MFIELPACMQSVCPDGPKIALRYPCLFVCLSVCWSAHLHLILSTITSCTMLTCDFPLVDLMVALQFEYSTGVATMSSLALLRVSHTKDPRSKGSIDVRLTDAYRAANR